MRLLTSSRSQQPRYTQAGLGCILHLNLFEQHSRAVRLRVPKLMLDSSLKIPALWQVQALTMQMQSCLI